VESCPALALTKDESLEIITHHADRCIGCKYCTWACPYDAPKFEKEKGIIEKCTLCQHRLEENKKPACANLCPTGALDYGEIIRRDQSRITGFTEKGIQPGIEIIHLRNRKPPRSVIKLNEQEQKYFAKIERVPPSKITLKKEWVLLIFTLIISALTSIIAAGSLGTITIVPSVFLVTAILGIVLSSIHLGKKIRAWRSVLNLRTSWLSREVLGFSFFVLFSLLWFIFPQERFLAYIAALLGFATSWFVDKVYQYQEKTSRVDVHSSSIFLTAILLTSVLTGNEIFILLILILKTLLYIYRKIYFVIHKRSIRPIYSSLRIISFVPVFLYMFELLQMANPWQLFVLILIGEVIDRLEFYLESEIITPAHQIKKDMGMLLQTKTD
jgi:DMSO reductase anchor subunit/ferredoxin